MQVSAVEHSELSKADVVVVPFWEEKHAGWLACQETAFLELARLPLESGDFHAKEAELLMFYPSKGKDKRILLLGLGSKDTCTSESLRRSYGSAIKWINGKKLKSAHVWIPSTFSTEPTQCLRGVFEGALLANYSYDQLKGESAKEESRSLLQKIYFCGVSAKDKGLLKKLELLVSPIYLVRDLVNGNADDVHIGALIKEAKEVQKLSDQVTTTILDKKQLERLEMGLLLAVGRCAVHEPALAIIEYKGDPKSKEKTAIVGKGITFDTGGLNLKPTGGIETMKCDMAGAATVIGILRAAVQLKLKLNVIGVLALAENAIGPKSYKPGDVYRSYSGKTVEIVNTDAEGRLILADALAYVLDKYKPMRVIDLATLTGAIVVALGEEATGLFSNNDVLAHAFEQAAARSDERVWRMPLYPEYKDLLKSSIADLKNAGGKKAGASSAAVFLQQFVKDTPWVHLDIAGTAYLSELNRSYHPTLATGVGVKLIIDVLEHLHDGTV